MENRGLFLTNKDIQALENCSKATASRRIQLLKDTFGKEKHQRVTIDEYISYEGITREQFNQYTSFKHTI